MFASLIKQCCNMVSQTKSTFNRGWNEQMIKCVLNSLVHVYCNIYVPNLDHLCSHNEARIKQQKRKERIRLCMSGVSEMNVLCDILCSRHERLHGTFMHPYMTN